MIQDRGRLAGSQRTYAPSGASACQVDGFCIIHRPSVLGSGEIAQIKSSRFVSIVDCSG